MKKSFIPVYEIYIDQNVDLICRRAEYIRTVIAIVDRREREVKREGPSGPGAIK
jgi:hypothetical protein